jgi:acyl-CoA thioesterase YciA
MDLTGWQLTHRSLVLYPDCNSTQNLFGGRMMSWMDVGAGMYAQCQTKSHVVTRAVGNIEFKVPVPLGWTCSVYARTVRAGRTSIAVEVLVTRRDMLTDTEEEVTRTEFVMVAVREVDGVLKPYAWNAV